MKKFSVKSFIAGFLVAVVSTVLVFALSGIKFAYSNQKTVKVGVCIYKFDDGFMTLYRGEIERYFESKSTDDVKYEVTIVDGKSDQAVQIDQINTFIANKVDVLILNLVNSSSADTIIDMVKSANIPTVFINREPNENDMDLWDKIAYVGVDYRGAGTAQGQIIAQLPNKGDINGDGVVSYVMVEGDYEGSSLMERTEYSIKAVIDSGMKVEELVKQSGMWDQSRGHEIVADALAQYGNKIEVVFCNNDSMALGAHNAIKAAGRTFGEDIYLVGIDAIDEAIYLVDRGEMTGTVHNDYVAQAQKAVDVAITAVDGEAFDKYYIIDYVKIVKK